MDIQQADLFRGLPVSLVKEIREIASKESFNQGDHVIKRGQPATHFFILLSGRIKLTIGETGHVVHIVSRSGEVFGWSSLVDRDTYTATAQCVEPTTVQKIEASNVKKLLEKDPLNAALFYKRLAGILGIRLIQSYVRYEKLFGGETLI